MGRVAEFERELRQKAGSRLGSWHLVDLHNHSPASEDYKYKGVDLIEKLATRISAVGLSLIMFTDHNKLPDLAFVKQLSDRTGRLILQGAELNVFVDAFSKPEGKVSKNLYYHLLVGFDPDGPQSPEYWLDHIYRTCNKESRSTGDKELHGIRASVAQLYEVLKDANAIIIPAHLHSTHDAFKSRSIDDIYSDPEFLYDAGNFFNALEVTSQRTAAYFDGTHTETGNLHKSCIQSSDSHEPENVGWRATYLQMEKPSYAELKAALELPFRVSLERPTNPSSFIHGLHIKSQFFPDIWLRLSPHCNVLIGVKGSGKTSILECLRFVLGADIPAARSDDVWSHLNAILGPGGKVTVLLKRADDAKILVERSIADGQYLVTFDDDRQEKLSSADGLRFPSYVLGWHEIEQVATDHNIRRVYMDTIAGRSEIRELEEKMKELGREIREKHDMAAKRYTIYKELHGKVSRLDELRKGLQDLKDANLVELKEQYQAATDHREALRQALEHFKKISAGGRSHINDLVSALDATTLDGVSPLEESVAIARDIIDSLNGVVEKTGQSLEDGVKDLTTRFEKQVDSANSAFEVFVDEYSRKTEQLTPEQRRLLESHREVLEQTKGLTGLKKDRDLVKQEIQDLLLQLQNVCDRLAVIIDQRTTLRKERMEEFNMPLQEYGVRLKIIPPQNAAEFQELSTRYANGAKALGELRQKLPERLAHLCLRAAYSNLYEGLLSDYGAMLFDHSELSYFLTVFENDDLQVELKVGRAGEEFSPIEQLSAGQRCTAIFPILLKLAEGVLIIDQPEDNLDNRHIATIIGPALLSEKRRRQLFFTSHNANLVVLSDSEAIFSFESDGSKGWLEAQGFLATKDSVIAKQVLDILDGGERALELRILKYGLHRP